MKKWMVVLIAVLLAWVVLAPRAGDACSTFCLNRSERPIFGRNYDFPFGDGLVFINKRNVRKTAIVKDGNPAQWTSRYGSLTFNQFGRELPHGGINEAGLVVEQMWLDETGYPAPDARGAIDNLQWMQYQLDNHATVAEVIASEEEVRIAPIAPARIHYLACDASGACATVEFIGGRMEAHTADRLPVAALTNSSYRESLGFLKEMEQGGSRQPAGDRNSSLNRFARAALAVQQKNDSDGVTRAFDILADLAQGDFTRWSIVYDIRQRRVHYRTGINKQQRTIDLKAFDLSCKTPVKVLDIDGGTGDVTRLMEDYTQGANRDLIERSYRKTELTAGIPDQALEQIASYPESQTCTEASL